MYHRQNPFKLIYTSASLNLEQEPQRTLIMYRNRLPLTGNVTRRPLCQLRHPLWWYSTGYNHCTPLKLGTDPVQSGMENNNCNDE
jgi:hypothetical protein